MTPDQTRQVLHIAARAAAADGVAPVDEATVLHLRNRSEEVRAEVRPEGFAALIGRQVHLCVDPDHRRSGVGGALLSQVLAEAAMLGRLEAWSHADHPAARRLAARHGFERVRELWLMRRTAELPLEELVIPDGLVVRGFRDSDTADLLELNRASFALHPEQGEMDEEELALRRAEPWFDPAGLLVAERDGEMLGFHWTKIQERDRGEVYVVAISPASQGLGLGRLLTLAGLHHLHSRGVREVILYVESDSAPAIRIYRDKLGFTHDPADTDVMYRR